MSSITQPLSISSPLFASLPRAVQSIILRAEKWLSSPANTCRLNLRSFDRKQLLVNIPTPTAATFALSLSTPHSFSTASDSLEDLEAEATQYCFSSSAARSIEDMLSFIEQWAVAASSAHSDDETRKGKKRKQIHGLAAASSSEEADMDWKGEKAVEDDDDEDDWGDSASPPIFPADSVDGWGDGDGDDAGDEDDDWGEAVEVEAVVSSRAYQDEVKADALQLKKHQSYTILTKADIPRLQTAMVKRVSGELNINTSAACTLLRHCKWDEQETMRRFNTDQLKLVTEAGVATQLHLDICAPLDSETERTCLVCYDDVRGDRLFALPCGHHFCISCWQEYLKNQIEGGDVSGRNALSTRCPNPKCKEVLGMEACELILSGDGQDELELLLSKYRKMLLNSFVDDSEGFTWCPKVGCERVVAHSKRRSTVSCVCGNLFCFGCKAEAHAPASCNEALQWLARDKGSANLDMKWILEQSKACPKCGTRTRKEGGCMHIVCTQCQNPWCWQCGKSDHHVYECNRPPWGENKESTTDLNRYLWYFERYFNHSQSGKVAEKQVSETQHKMDDLATDAGMHVRATEFLLQAVRVVIECRRILRWTYVHAYYIDSGAERTLFEYRQGELENMTEKLNKLTEGDIEQLSAARMQVLNTTQALSAYMEGMENDKVKDMVAKKQTAAGETEDEDEKEGGKEGKRRGKKGKGKGKGKKSAEVEEQWTTDAQGVIVRAKVEKGKKKDSHDAKKGTELDTQPAAEDGGAEDEQEEEDEEDVEVEDEEVEAEDNEADGEVDVDEGENEEMEQQAILADIQSRTSLSPTSATAAAASAPSPKSNSASRADLIVLE